MKKEIADKWIEALKSGEYKQVLGKLCLVDKSTPEEKLNFCCLGVLCDLYQNENEDKLRTQNILEGTVAAIFYEDSCNSLPLKVMEWSGMTTTSGNYGSIDTPTYGSLMNDNDYHKKSFEQIAGIISRNWESL